MWRNLLTAVLLMALMSCKQKDQNTITETKVSFRQEAAGAIYRGDTLIVGSLKIEIADTPFERQTGLMYRESMEKDQGMWFVFEEEAPRYFYMKNTLIPLDLLYADKNKKIVSIIRNAQPLNKASLPSQYPAMYVLELNGGSADRWDIRVNDSISIIP
ncbi:DUF192 domain-containing protein [Robertkochia sediminum]|uniref:DUF192 domain-containing protein n=1 Tax=Robertkochia sediminum TaxID=2785326 RepID=UPI00193468E6|nr:DUF192 domain-containing protein [Robertkochia sediminum]MBL7472594.1 DUF192 domain-containing protein [Robertkochia sediminum]